MNFKYKARDVQGNLVQGTGIYNTQDEVVKYLRDQKLIPVSIEADAHGAKKTATLGERTLWEKMKRIGTVPNRVRMVFFRQLATMLRSGLTIANSMDIIEEQESNLIFKDIVHDIKRRLDGGISLSQALSVNKGFTPLMIALVHAGEESGRLEQSLDRVARVLERNEAIRRKVKSALTYPAVILVFAVIIVWVFITFVLPKFEQVFAQMQIELPPLTKFMFRASEFISSYGIFIFAGIVAFIFAIISIGKTPAGRLFFDRLKLKTPIMKGVIFRSIMARSTQTLSAMVNAGVPILSGLEMAGNVSDNLVAKHAWTYMMGAAERGQSLAVSSASTGLFPPMVTQMIRVGEESGQLDEMLGKVATWYEEELDEQIKILTSMMEPMLIVIVGGLVTLIALSIYGPITAAIEQMM